MAHVTVVYVEVALMRFYVFKNHIFMEVRRFFFYQLSLFYCLAIFLLICDSPRFMCGFFIHATQYWLCRCCYIYSNFRNIAKYFSLGNRLLKLLDVLSIVEIMHNVNLHIGWETLTIYEGSWWGITGSSCIWHVWVHICPEQGLWLIQSSPHVKMTSVHQKFYGVLAHCTCSCMQSYFLVTHPRPPPTHFLLSLTRLKKKPHPSAAKSWSCFLNLMMTDTFHYIATR